MQTETAPSLYTASDEALVQEITAQLKRLDKPRSWLAKAASMSGATVSQVLSGKYPSPPGELLAKMMASIAVEASRQEDGTPGYVKGSVHDLLEVVADRTRKHANFGVFCGSVGIGKTRALDEYAAAHPLTLVVKSNPQMTAGTLMTELLTMLGESVPAGLDRKFSVLADKLTGSTYLICIDEAENNNATGLHYLRRLRDKAGVGIVLVGTERLRALLRPEHGQFDQIRSRVSMWPATVTGITRDDADDIARARLDMDVPDDVLDALWDYGKGSARVLTESLLPGLRDYGLGHGKALTAALVDAVATQLLSMEKRAGAKGGK